MPVLKSAQKKLKQDRVKTKFNRIYRLRLKKAIKQFRASKAAKDLKIAYRAIDRAAKKKIIHKNKAARIKSRLTALLKKAKKQ